jgi:hypothetical protein
MTSPFFCADRTELPSFFGLGRLGGDRRRIRLGHIRVRHPLETADRRDRCLLAVLIGCVAEDYTYTVKVVPGQ